MKTNRLTLILGLAAALVVVTACLIGPTPMSPSTFLTALLGGGEENYRIVLWEIRMPRAIAAFIVGGALGFSGAALQGLLRNPLAEPGVLGVSASASLFATLVIFYGLASASPIMIAAAAIAGAVTATLVLAAVAFSTGSITTLILIGVALSSFAGAVMVLLLNLAPNPFALSDLINWSLGSVANRSFNDILLAAPFMFAGAILVMLVRRDLDALSLGDDGAIGLGVHLKRTRILVVLGTGVMTGAAVSIAGAIGFVGIVAPHVLRPFVGYSPARLLVPSALAGGIILVLADIGVRLIPTPSELKLGVVAALIGAPAFAWIAAKQNRGEQA